MPCYRLILLLLCTAALGAADNDRSAEDDLLVLVNNRSLPGEVLTERSDHEVVTIRTEAGELSLPRRIVKNIEWGFQTRKQRLPPGDYPAHLELAQWCVTHQRKSEALDLLADFADDPQLDIAGLRLLARLTDELRSAEQALPYYRRYREQGGRDAETLERLRQLEETERAYLERRKQIDEQRADQQVQEGLEARAQWSPEDQRWANPVTATLVTLQDQGGDQMLRLHFESGDSHKATVRWRKKLDVRASSILVLRINNPGEVPVKFSVAVKSGSDWEYFESRAQTIPADDTWHRVTFDLGGKDFKSARDKYRSHAFAIADPGDIRELQLQIHNGKSDGDLFINDMGFLTPDLQRAGEQSDD